MYEKPIQEEGNDLFESVYEESPEPVQVSGQALKEVKVPFRSYGLKQPLVTDIDDIRLSIIGPSATKIGMSVMWKLLKDMVGKDLSTFSMPVFASEPTTIL